MWTKRQITAFQRGLDTAAKWDEAIRRLEEVAKHAPAFADRVAQLRAMRDALYQVSATAIAIDPEGDGQ